MKINTIGFPHLRNISAKGEILSRGGTTVAYRETNHGTIEFAEAWCSPADNFNKAYGRSKASGRLSSRRYRRQVHDMDRVQFRNNVISGQFVL